MTQYPPQQHNPYPQQPYGAPPKKKDNTLLIVLGVIGGLLLLCCCGALGAMVWTNKIFKDTVESYSESSSANVGEQTITEGSSFTYGGGTIGSGWSVSTDSVGSTPEGLSVTNDESMTSSYSFTINFYKDGAEIGDSYCSAFGVGPGASETVSCLSTLTDVSGYDRLTVSE